MKSIALVLVAIVAVSALSEFEYQDMFTSWLEQNERAYTHDEFFRRYNTFKANVDFIAASNAANKSYTLGVNKFADMNTEEFGQIMCGFKPQLNVNARFDEPTVTPTVMANDVDWREKGAVTPIKDQGQCGSCWAFSATGGIEGAVAVKSGTLINLSEQELVDCAGSYGNEGCNGGLMTYSFQYVRDKKGLLSEADYPYTARDGSCKRGSKAGIGQITTYKELPPTEKDLENQVGLGPVSIAIEADQMCFQFYKSGVLDDASCGTNLDHGVTAVGFKSQGVPKSYWIVKNSWGTSWGFNGYINLVKDKNQCGIKQMNSVPVV